MGGPFRAAAHQAADAAAVGDRCLDLQPVPFRDGLGQRLARAFLRAGNAQRALAMVRMVGVQEHRPAIPRRVMARERIP